MPRPAGLIDFTAERARHAGFVGREAHLARLDQLLVADHRDRWVVVTGGTGMGKSALLTEWLARREATGAAVLHHFIRRGEYDWDDPSKLVASLVAQIVARFPDLPELEPDERMHPAARLDATLRRVSQEALVPREERLVLLVDGLDEYDPPPGITSPDPLAAFLPHTLPAGVSVLCASRPRHPYVDMLATRGAVQVDLDDEDAARDNAATVRAFWEEAAPELGLEEAFIEEAVARADGNMQHAAMLRKHLATIPPAKRRVEDIPRGLAALLASAWERVASEEAAVVGLGIPSGARCRSGQNALNPDAPEAGRPKSRPGGSIEIPGSERADPTGCGASPIVDKAASMTTVRIYGVPMTSTACTPATPRGGSSSSRCRRGVRGARSVQPNRRSRWPAPRPR